MQDTLTKKRILLSENTKNWERERYDIAFGIINEDIQILEKLFLVF